MHIIIEKNPLIKAMRAVSGVAENNSQTDQSPNYVLLQTIGEELLIRATDSDISIHSYSSVDEIINDGIVLVTYRKLHDSVKSLQSNVKIELEYKENKLFVRAGKSKFCLSTASADDYQEMQEFIEEQKITVKERVFVDLLERTAYSMAEQDVRYYLNGMLLDIKASKLYAVAVDGHRLAINHINLNEKQEFLTQVIVPRRSILELMRVLNRESDLDIDLKFNKKRLQVRGPSFVFNCVLLEGRFPDYLAVIPNETPYKMVGTRMQLKEAFARASVLFSEKIKIIYLDVYDGCMKLFATTKDQDKAEEEINVEYMGDRIQIGFNSKYIIDFLNSSKADKIRMNFSANSSGAALLEGVGDPLGRYVIMPVQD